jgi:Predicted xylanase/chitin deacetylase
MTRPGPGMDHDLYRFSPITARPALRWPEGKAVAMNVILYFEHWELGPPKGSYQDPRLRDPIADFYPAYRMWTWREYGHRVGIFRILKLLDELGLPVTVAANSAACQRFPYLVEAFLKRGYEFAAHGTHASRMLTSRMSETEERAVIAESIDVLTRLSGRRPAGWVGQDMGESTRTPAILADMGFDYLIDWPNDDQPFPMTLGRPMVALPLQSEWDPVQSIWSRKIAPERYAVLVGEALQTLQEEGRESGRYFGLQIHPWILGKPHIFPHFARALRAAATSDDMWLATAGETAGVFARQQVWD